MKRVYSTNDINQLFDYINNNDLLALKRATINGINLTVTDKNKNSLLHIASKLGYLSIVKFLVQYGIDYKQKDIYGNTALDLSIKYNKFEVIKFLSSLVYTSNDSNEIKDIFNAIKNDNLQLLKFLLESNNYEIEDENKNTLLHQAVISNKFNIVEFLIKEKKVDVNKKNIWNITPLEEAVLAKKIKIADYLRENNAYYHIKLDSEQITVGQRTDFFDKIDIILMFLSISFPSYKLIQFFHTTYTSNNLLCCSKYLSKNKISDELFTITSNIIFENNYHLFNNKIVNNCIELSQSDFFLAPYCKSYNINTLGTIKFTYKDKLLGYFLIWCDNIENIIIENIPETTSIINNIIENNYKALLSLSGNIFIQSTQHKKISQYIDNLLVSIYKRDSYHFSYPNSTFVNILISLEKDWDQLIFNEYFNKIINAIIYQYNINIPIKPSLYIYNTNCQLVELLIKKKVIHNYKLNFENKTSYIYTELVNFYSTLKSDITVDINNNNITLFTPRDIYDIIGNHTYNNNIIDYINELLEKEINKETIFELANLIGGNLRINNVIGVAVGNQYCLFMPYQEIDKAINFIFNSMIALDKIKKIYFFYTGLVEYVHPFHDCNGRIFRILTNVMLRKIGVNTIIYKKIMSYREFIQLCTN